MRHFFNRLTVSPMVPRLSLKPENRSEFQESNQAFKGIKDKVELQTVSWNNWYVQLDFFIFSIILMCDFSPLNPFQADIINDWDLTWDLYFNLVIIRAKFIKISWLFDWICFDCKMNWKKDVSETSKKNVQSLVDIFDKFIAENHKSEFSYD